MGIIKVLTKQIANLIAAGEVVERPASVVKELAENALDAGSTSITIELKNGGVTYIRVTDDGYGMSADDALIAFERHATSKISKEDDLIGIHTMGFRGEALASIAAVARVELLTRQEGSIAGHLVRIEGGEVCESLEAASPKGTTVVVRDLFFNTPARKKFLKKDATEAAAIESVVERLALCRPDVSIRLLKDGKETFFTSGDGLSDAVSSVFGKNILNDLLPVDYRQGGIHVTGYVGKPLAARPNRNMQYFSVNRRSVKSKVFTFAVEDAFKGSILTEKYPICVVEVGIDFTAVDVNVHPSKIEVKFADERRLYDAVYFAVKDALEKDVLRPTVPERATIKPVSFAPPEPPPVQTKFERMDVAEYLAKYAPKPKPKSLDIMPEDWKYSPEKKTPIVAASKPEDLVRFTQKMDVTAPEEQKEEPQHVTPEKAAEEASSVLLPEQLGQEEVSEPRREVPEFKYVGELFRTYIIIEIDEEVVMIDKHAAQERILYEKLRAAKREAAGQRLMLPEIAPLTKEEFAAVLSNIDFVNGLGFEIEDFGDNSFVVREVPLLLAECEPLQLLTEIAGRLLEGRGDASPKIYDEVLHSIACRAAIKGGDANGEEELKKLAATLLAVTDIKYCPHGRPVAVTMTKMQFEKQFKR